MRRLPRSSGDERDPDGKANGGEPLVAGRQSHATRPCEVKIRSVVRCEVVLTGQVKGTIEVDGSDGDRKGGQNGPGRHQLLEVQPSTPLGRAKAVDDLQGPVRGRHTAFDQQSPQQGLLTRR